MTQCFLKSSHMDLQSPQTALPEHAEIAAAALSVQDRIFNSTHMGLQPPPTNLPEILRLLLQSCHCLRCATPYKTVENQLHLGIIVECCCPCHDALQHVGADCGVVGV